MKRLKINFGSASDEELTSFMLQANQHFQEFNKKLIEIKKSAPEFFISDEDEDDGAGGELLMFIGPNPYEAYYRCILFYAVLISRDLKAFSACRKLIARLVKAKSTREIKILLRNYFGFAVNSLTKDELYQLQKVAAKAFGIEPPLKEMDQKQKEALKIVEDFLEASEEEEEYELF